MTVDLELLQAVEWGCEYWREFRERHNQGAQNGTYSRDVAGALGITQGAVNHRIRAARLSEPAFVEKDQHICGTIYRLTPVGAAAVQGIPEFVPMCKRCERQPAQKTLEYPVASKWDDPKWLCMECLQGHVLSQVDELVARNVQRRLEICEAEARIETLQNFSEQLVSELDASA